jgi:hypothetical protein
MVPQTGRGGNMPKYLTVHNETTVDRVLLESRWTEIARRETRAKWQMTLFNMRSGRRYCEWDAPSAQVIEEIFGDLGIKWSEILEVSDTRASDWRFWEARARTGMLNCWEVMNCGKEPGGANIEKGRVCPVAEDRKLWGKNRGLYAGRSCWSVLGTLCEGSVQDTFGAKIEVCSKCTFFDLVKQEEQARFEA